MSQIQIQETRALDARGLLCPMPVIRTAKAMRELAPGEVLKLTATDRGSIADIPAWAESTGNELIEWHEEGEAIVFFLRKSSEEA